MLQVTGMRSGRGWRGARLGAMFVCPECGVSQPAPGQCSNDRSALLPVGEDALIGTTVGAYRVARLLGVGGMGRVYKGVQPQIGSRVAIKVLSRECSDRRDLVERFFSEAKAVNLIRHESIVNVLDLASLPDGRPYIIMEYLDGAPLAAAIEGVPHAGPLPLGGIARLAAEVLDALGAAHAKGIVHRDLKPDNIFVTPAGRPKVLDFGIAKLLPELGGSYTQTGSLLGTPHYMAPEQASGRPVDHRADLYAMGVILFECVTGGKPFHGDSLFDLLRKHVDEPPPPPAARRPDLPPAFEHVILTALAKAPDHRWQSAYAMSTALQQATAQLPPAQWAPVTGGTASAAMRAPSGGGWSGAPPSWSHTPPATPMPGPAYSQVTGASGAPPGAYPTTVSGQVGAAAAKKSRGGMWLALTVLVLGGGITAGVVAGHGSPATTTAAGTAASPAAPSPTVPSTTPGAPRAGLPAQPPTTPGAPAADAWITYRALSRPGWDPKHVDVDAFIAWATETAKQAIPDAQLVRLDAMNVYPDGHADLTLSGSGFLSVRFLSPSRSKRDPSVPVGAQPHWRCMFQVMATMQTGPIIVPMDGTSCEDERAQPPPHCSIRGVWQQMIAKKAPGGNAVAQLGYWASGKDQPPLWYGSVAGAFSQRFPDACP
jgi:serine/threonine protein kinase